MRILILLSLVCACDSVIVDSKAGDCIEHNWAHKGIYKIQKRDGTDILLKNFSTNEELKISGLDKGWNEVQCPDGKPVAY